MSLDKAWNLLKENQQPGISQEQKLENLNEAVLLLLKELYKKDGRVRM